MKKQASATSKPELKKLEPIKSSTHALLFLFAFIACILVLIIHYLLLQPIKFFRYWLLQSIEFFRSRWGKLGKYGRVPFLALLSYIMVLISHDLIFSRMVLFLIKKVNWELIVFLSIFTLVFIVIILYCAAKISYALAQGIHVFIRTSLEFVEIFHANTTKPFRKKEISEHSFRVVDAILKYFGIIATFAAGISFVINYLGSQEHARIEREKMSTELFNKATEQVSAKDTNANVSGIYLLEQSAINSPKN